MKQTKAIENLSRAIDNLADILEDLKTIQSSLFSSNDADKKASSRTSKSDKKLKFNEYQRTFYTFIRDSLQFPSNTSQEYKTKMIRRLVSILWNSNVTDKDEIRKQLPSLVKSYISENKPKKTTHDA